jgi:hypothetical protein
MNSIWGKKFQFTAYSAKAIKLFNDKIKNSRLVVSQEFLNNQDLCRDRELYQGSRYSSNEQILWALESNVSETEFMQEPDHYLQRILLGALSADYYYKFEKDWG